ncbi:hypothetical protein ACFL2Q_04005 [Thermodesulfobacteriota bacterium]
MGCGRRLRCVIGATKIYRRDDDLPHRFLVIHYTGIADEIFCLDTEDDKVYPFSRAFGNHKVADSFDEWFQQDIIELVKQMEEDDDSSFEIPRPPDRLLRSTRRWRRVLRTTRRRRFK